MKTVKVKFIGFGNAFRPEELFLYQVINKYYDVVISDDPDYIICSVFPNKNNAYYSYCNYPQVRIMYSGENYIPDFNLIDYAISLYPLDFQDRHLYFPTALFRKVSKELVRKDRNLSEIMAQKVYFANFIASHESENNIRGNFFRKLCEYKRVEAPGTYLNNMEGHITVNRFDNSKYYFQKKCKFTICFESTLHEGFVTEKIADAFYADTIPIYYGSSTVKSIFNEKAFINCTDYDSFDAVIEKIIELDQDDAKYLEMLRQPVYKDYEWIERKSKEAEKFIRNIFDQPLDKAYRRSRVYYPKYHENYIIESGGGFKY